VVNNITAIGSNESNQTFNYDVLSRLVNFRNKTTANYQNFSYDENGNRLTQNQETNKTRRFTYLDHTNTLEAIKYYHTIDENTTNITKETHCAYDATGNIIDDGTHTYTYDGRNRLIAVDDNISYQYNYDNKRVSKTVGDTTTYYIYDAHKLTGEYQADGAVTKEYVYYNDTPIAIIETDNTKRIYADHLKHPKKSSHR